MYSHGSFWKSLEFHITFFFMPNRISEQVLESSRRIEKLVGGGGGLILLFSSCFIFFLLIYFLLFLLFFIPLTCIRHIIKTPVTTQTTVNSEIYANSVKRHFCEIIHRLLMH